MNSLLEGLFGETLVATITEFFSLFVTVIINVYFQWLVLYLPELKVTPISLYFFSIRYKYKIEQRYRFNLISKYERSKY